MAMCRTSGEFDKGHAPGAINIPSHALPGPAPLQSEFLEKLAAIFPDKDKKLVVACQSGRRSKETTQWLVDEGYSNVVDMETGFGGW
jgi:hydroxyacylglutathione hydrolase